MTDDNNSEPDVQRLAALLRTLDVDAIAPNEGILESIRHQAAARFADAAVRSAERSTPAVSGIGADSDNNSNPKRRRPMMMLLASRGIAGLAAAVSAVVLWLSLSTSSSALSTTPFSTVLNELQRASSMQLKVTSVGKSADVWVRAPGLLRREESPRKYQIAAGSRLWEIDESAQTTTESDSPWYIGPEEQIDLLGLLDIGVTDASSLLKARPVDLAIRDGRDCLVYRIALPTAAGSIDVEAAADAGSLQLVEILAWKSGMKRQGPPLAEMRLVALNAPIADEKFAVTKSLTEDGRIGKISDSQGIVVLRPMVAKRWTPVCRTTLLRPGDWLRTELRGANAAKVTLTSEVEITLGPGTLVECISENEVRLHSGMVQAMSPKRETADGEKPFSLLAPREGMREFKPGEKVILRVDRTEKLVDVRQTPAWLAGFEGTSNNESLGSLVVTMPDGRNEPLTVGYHRVSVEIHDQIARTTIEESFVNHTLSRLEGVFHFPLPQDASISGFGMWIGNDLIEADVVEKQRAREIYETILREKRDPGLLEWTGGNIFKARVFPIEARSEKRIKIVYTQVLPLRANRYRYTYGLRSELLRTTPLRELSLNMTVNSAMGLKSVTCPTHAARIQHTVHSGSVDFAAQEYSPTKDFEVICEVDGRQSDVVVVPHQRGEDGYFLIQLTPPGADGNWQRELLPDGEPLTLVLLCDTSMSMDEEKRRQQAEFIAAVLASLSPEDRFQLVAADVATAWASEKPMAANAENIAASTKFLSDRMSLGWTDLDRAFKATFDKIPANSHVIYVGDGVVSAGDTDPAAFVKRLEQMASGGRQPSEFADGNQVDARRVDAVRPAGFACTLHTVTVGNSNDSVVMRGIATVGSGSARTIGGEQTAPIAALELLNEIAQPGLRDLNVEFHGLKVAAVYPERLPNIAAGTQQILVGRYLPEGEEQHGEIIVTGKRGSEDVRYAAKVSLKDAEEGNSFIPRLWARAHLDQLLAQGGSQAIQDDIIRLSEEFHIITPYTSLLVLETDADRERFGVQRRYEMRDGERYFTEGRNNASFELVQQQMQRAGDWRLGLRRQILRRLSELGRNEAQLRNDVQAVRDLSSHSRSTRFRNAMSLSDGSSLTEGRGGDRFESLNQSVSEYLGLTAESAINESLSAGDVELNRLGAVELESRLGQKSDRSDHDAEDILATDRDEEESAGRSDRMSLSVVEKKQKDSKFEFFDVDVDFASISSDEAEGLRGLSQLFRSNSAGGSFGGFDDRANRFSSLGRSYYQNTPDYTAWINALFPVLAPAPSAIPAAPVALPSTWSPEAIALSRSLLRKESLLALEGGIELRHDSEQFDPRWNRSTGRSVQQVLYSPTAWLTRGENPHEQTLINYCDSNERLVYSPAFGLGRIRKPVGPELKSPPLPLNDYSLSLIHETYAGWNAAIEPAGDNSVRLVLTMKDSPTVVHFTIDTAKHVIVLHESFNDGKSTGNTTLEDFIETAGSWWATKSVYRNADGAVASETLLTIKALTKNEYTQRLNELLVDKPAVQFVRQPFVRLKVARQSAADGTSTFDDLLTMILHNAQLQQWDEVLEHVDGAEKLAADKPGVRWLRTVLLATMRRNEEARQRLVEEAQKLSPRAQQDEVFLAEFILGQLNAVTETNEFRAVHQSLKPVYARPLAERIPAVKGRRVADNPLDVRMLADFSGRIMEIWTEREASCLERLGKHEEAMSARREIAIAMPWNVYSQQAYAQKLAVAGQYDAAHAWIRQELARPERTPDDIGALRYTAVEFFRQQGKWNELLKWTTEWIEGNPESQSYYSAYGVHISAMICNAQLEAAYSLADKWLTEGRVEGRMTSIQKLRFDTALNFANGQIPFLNFQRMDERWFAPLAETARFFVRHPHHSDVVWRCVSNQYFVQSDTVDQLRGEWLTLLRAESATLTTAQMSQLIGLTLSGRMELPEPIDDRRQLDASEVPDSVWAQIAATLKTRWTETDDKDQKHPLGELLQTIYSSRFRETMLLPFLRERILAAHQDFTVGYISSLFATLRQTPWTDEIEAEAFAVLRTLSPDAQPGVRLAEEVPNLHGLVDDMLRNRIAAGEKTLADQGELDKLTRRELGEKKSAIRTASRSGLAARLAELARTADAPMAAWFRMEQIWLDVQLDQNRAESDAVCWQILGDVPPKPRAEDAEDADDPSVDGAVDSVDIDEKTAEANSDAVRLTFFDMQLKQRAFAALMNLAVRSSAPAASVDRLLKYVDAGIATGADSAGTWRQTRFELLIALDRPDELEVDLRIWIRDKVTTALWRQSLARLLAERGRIAEAIQLFEACAKDKLLSAADYRLLSDWYLVSDNRAAYERTRIESFRMMPENALQQMLYSATNRWSQSNAQLPSELDENTLFALKVLYEKSAQPENYLHQVRQLYGACRDFRLLQMIPDAVSGRSSQQVYSFIQNLNGSLLVELRNEATADEILTRITELKASGSATALRVPSPDADARGADAAPLAKTLTAIDLRALDLLEAMVERRSSEVLNQPGPHVDACLAAMQRAFTREWAEGEPRMMATFLLQLGAISDNRLKAEQLREMRELLKNAVPASRDHLSITTDLCHLLFMSYGERDEALRLMEIEVREYTQANNGRWPYSDNEFLSRYVSLLEAAGRHAVGETLIKKQIATPGNDEQNIWMKARLMTLYRNAFDTDGAVSVGTGRAALFAPLVAMTLKELAAAPNEQVRYQLVSDLCSIFSIAHQHKLPGVAAAVKSAAFETVPAVLKLQEQHYGNTVALPVSVVNDVLGPKTCLKYLVERMEQYPDRFEIQYYNSWAMLGNSLAEYRHRSGASEVDDRVLALVIGRLKDDLRAHDQNYSYIYRQHYDWFWAEKKAAFAAAAEEVLNEKRSSGRRAVAVAEYLGNDLDMAPRAIEILYIAHGTGLLNESEQSTLATFLRDAKRYAEMIPILEPLMKAHPDSIGYRTELMSAYFHAQRPEQLQTLQTQTHDYFHSEGRWTEGNAASLASACYSVRQWDRAKLYFTEVIALHQRTNPDSVNDAALSYYYHQLSQTESALGHTSEAVEAAFSGIVCWESRHEQRASSMQMLSAALGASKDLDAFVAQQDAAATQSGQDNPIIRKALGQTYQSRNVHAKAIVQFTLALELQPNDKETHQALIACYDATDNPAAASLQLRKLIDLQAHDLTLYKQLADRMKDNPLEAERAATSIIESSPNEAESHHAIAELRQSQSRWAEAIPHWEQVARFRKLEPTGLLRLARAQIHEKRLNEASQSIQTLKRTEWPSRFGDVTSEIRQLEEKLQK